MSHAHPTTHPARKFIAGIAIGAALFVPGQAAFAQGGPQDKAPAPRPEPKCNPILASCDLTSQPEEPDCNPILASCDLVDRPDQPDQPEDPGQPEAEVDEPVIANPNFTG